MEGANRYHVDVPASHVEAISGRSPVYGAPGSISWNCPPGQVCAVGGPGSEVMEYNGEVLSGPPSTFHSHPQLLIVEIGWTQRAGCAMNSWQQ